MSAAELVTVTIDDRVVEVPKGTGLVETAAAAGIEIPVFCYEPRLGPPVGACRMCLVELEGVPKLQAGCTLTAQPDMVVKTAATSDKAAEGQNATLEFILVNHPLDCPVCDKGGECPLQDLTFRYGPGATRMTFPKVTFEKPIPVSPTIALDRERCILCYRCTRFSSDVAEDGELVAIERGAGSIIATFDDEPYRGRFSGNVTELCPVGALTSTQYRFEARPWEIQNVPTVCGLCPVGCNVAVTTREGKVKRVLSRNHPEVDGGWLCDKGRFGFPYLYAGDRVSEPLLRLRRQGFERIGWERALDEAESLLRAAQGRIVTALSGSETLEQAYALGKLLREGLGSHTAVLPEATSPALDAFRLPLAAIADAELVVVLGDEPVEERAPVVDLWLKAARRNGAEVLTYGPAGDVQTSPAGAAAACRELAEAGSELGTRLRGSQRAVLVWSGSGGGGGARLAELAHALGWEGREGCGAFHLGATPNGRGVAEAWAAASDAEGADPDPIGLLVVSGDEAAADPSVRALAERAEHVLAITMFQGLAVGWADLVLPATSYLERDGTTMNVEGRLQRQRRAVIPPCPDENAWLSQLASRFGVDVPAFPPLVFAELAATSYGGAEEVEVAERAPMPARAAYVAPDAATTPDATGTSKGAEGRSSARSGSCATAPLFSGPAVERVPELQFQRPEPVLELAAEDAERRQIESGDAVSVRSNGTSVELRAPDQPPARPRGRPHRRRARRRPPPAGRGGEGTDRAVVDLDDQGRVIINLVLFGFAYLTLIERKVMGRMQLRYGPNRAGPYGLLQPIADLVKLLHKESFFPIGAIDFLYILSPFVAAFTALTTFSVIPWGDGWVIAGYQVNGYVADVPIALILIFAIGSIGIYGFIVGGWSSDSKFALLGSMRTCAQLVSYEVSLALSVLGVVLMAQSLSLVDIAPARTAPGGTSCRSSSASSSSSLAGTAETARAPVRPARGRAGARRRLPHGVRRHALRPLLDERVHQPDHALRPLRDALPRRLALLLLGLPRAALVPPQARGPDLRLHLDADDAAAPPLRPADALRLEGAAARRDDQRRRHGRPRRLDRLR